MKICFLSYLHGFGGAEKMIVTLANNMSKRGHDVTMVSIGDNQQCYVLAKSIKNININDNYPNQVSRAIKRFIGIFRIIYVNKPDVVVNFWLQPLYLAVPAKLLRTVKLIYSERGDPSDKEYGIFLRLIRSISFYFTDGFVFQSKAVRDYFSENVRNKSSIIKNPVKISGTPATAVNGRKNKIVNIGRLHEQKNQELLIRAFAEFFRSHDDYILEIYGDGSLMASLINLTNELNIGDKVSFFSAVSNIHEKIYDAKMFVLSSDYEGMPNALLECMALGIPCISTNYSLGGAEEIIKNYENGIVVERNNLRQLLSAMLYIADNNALAERMGNNAKKIKVAHDEARVFDCWEQFLVKTLYK